MSSARHAVHRADNFTGFGKRPDFTPSHQHVFPRGMTLSTCDNRKNPVSGIYCISTSLLLQSAGIRHEGSVRAGFSSLTATFGTTSFLGQFYHRWTAIVSENRTERQSQRRLDSVMPFAPAESFCRSEPLVASASGADRSDSMLRFAAVG